MSQKLLIDADLVGNALASDTKAETELAAKFSTTAVVGKSPVAIADAEGNPILDKSWGTQSGSGQGNPIGTIIAVACSSTYVPEGCLPCDGTEYAQSQFSDLWDNYFLTDLLDTVTYAEQFAMIASGGACPSFAVDTANGTFKVPYLPNGYVTQQAMTDSEIGKAYGAGLPEIDGNFYGTSTAAGDPNGAFARGNPDGMPSAKGATTATTAANTFVTNFRASRVNSIYGNSATVQPKAIALRHFVVVATGSINQSMMDWSAWASALQGKANIDLLNVAANVDVVIDFDFIDTGAGSFSWYKKWRSGLIEQGGCHYIGKNSGNNAKTIPLATLFKTSNYAVTASFVTASDESAVSGVQMGSITRTFEYFLVGLASGQAYVQAISWYAVGR